MTSEPATTRHPMIAIQDPSHHHQPKLRNSTTTHLGGDLDRTTVILTVLGLALLGLLALLQR